MSSAELCCKVGSTLSENELSIDLATRWVDERESIRSLAQTINVAVIEQRLREAGTGPVSGEAENFYRLLTDDERPDAERVEGRRRLEGVGVDTDAVTDQFVSHQTVYNHLTGCLDCERAPEEPSVESHADTVYSLQSRTEPVTEQSLKTLQNAGAIDLEEFDVLVDVRVHCHTCGRVTSVAEVLNAGGCQCQSDV